MSKSAKPVSEIDRLIELASDEKPRATVETLPQHSLSLENEKDSGPSMWRVLIQLRVLLPYLAKVLPLLERGLLGTNITGQVAAPKIDTSNLDREIAGVGEAQRDLNTAVKAQTAEVRELQEQVAVLTKSLAKTQSLNEETAANLSALKKLTETSVTITIALLLILAVLVGLLLFRHW
jgi:septal ring factor EnvC (AmiA/AmiB activator)